MQILKGKEGNLAIGILEPFIRKDPEVLRVSSQGSPLLIDTKQLILQQRESHGLTDSASQLSIPLLLHFLLPITHQ